MTYVLDAESRLVRIAVRKNVPSAELIEFYERILAERAFQPGFGFLVDRRKLQEPPPAETIRQVIAYLRTRADRLLACRMAVVIAVATQERAWRSAEVLAGYYTPLTLRLFDDYDLAEAWAMTPE